MRHAPGLALRVLVVLTGVVALVSGVPTVTATTPGADRTSYSVPFDAHQAVYSPGAGTPGADVVLTGAGTATGWVTTTRATTRVRLLLEAQACEGAPQVQVAVDGRVHLNRRVYGNGVYALVGSWAAGRHRLTFRLLTAHHTATCDRTLTVYGASFWGYSDGSVYPIEVQQLPHLDDATLAPAGAVPRDRYTFDVSGSASMWLRQDSQGARELDLWAWTAPCTGTRPRLVLRLDEQVLYDDQVPQSEPGEGPGPSAVYLQLRGRWPDGRHEISAVIDATAVSGDCVAHADLSSVAFRGLA